MAVVLVSSDNMEFKVDEDVANKFVTVKNLMEDIGSDGAIPLTEVDSKTLEKVITYTKYHLENPFTQNEDEKYMTSWDEQFCNVDRDTIFALVLAANYLDYKELLETTTQKIADMIKGKTPEQIRELFQIENDFTLDELEQVRKENQWIEDEE